MERAVMSRPAPVTPSGEFVLPVPGGAAGQKPWFLGWEMGSARGHSRGATGAKRPLAPLGHLMPIHRQAKKGITVAKAALM